MKQELKLFKHQKVSTKFCKRELRVFDMSDPGTGKTAVHIVAFLERWSKNKKLKCLVLAPKQLLYSTWKVDFNRFAPDIRVSIAFASNRSKALSTPADVYVVNHDAAKALVELPQSFWRDFDTIIVDESTAFKHHTSARSKAIGKLMQHFPVRHLLSATPTSNGVCDIWHQVKLLDDGQRLGSSFFSFRAAVCTPVPSGIQGVTKWVDKPNAEAIVSALIADITIRHRFEDCVDIPKNHQYSVPFVMSSAHRRTYTQMETECVLMLEDRVVSAVNAAVLYNKLLQVASGAVYDSTGGYSVLDSDRTELAVDLAEARTHTIIFFNWSHQRDQLAAELAKRGMSYGIFDGTTGDRDRAKLVDQFQAGMLRVLLAHPQSAGHGLTLTRGVATVWASPTWNLEHYLQGLKRIHRIGQSLKTETIMLLAEDTIEQRVYEALMKKDSKMSGLLEYLKR